MRIPEFRTAARGLCVLALAAGTAGCHKDESPAPIAADQIPKTLDGAFQGADAGTKAAAAAASAAVQGDSQGQAVELLEKLSRQPDLTPEQREASTRAALAVRKKIMDAAAAGDQAAKAFLEQQAAGK